MPHALAVTDDLTIYHAADYKQKFIDALAATDELELELAGVGEMDTAGLQLLILLKMEAQRSGKQVRIVAHSRAVSEFIDFCNLGARFGDPMVIAADENT